MFFFWSGFGERRGLCLEERVMLLSDVCGNKHGKRRKKAEITYCCSVMVLSCRF